MQKIIFVDDEPYGIENMRREFDFSKADAEIVATAESAEEALAILREQRVDVVITDVSMPGMNGLDMVESLRVSGWNGEVIFLSAYRRVDNMRRSLRFDTTDYLFKPVCEGEMIAVLLDAKRRAEIKRARRSEAERALWQDLIAGKPVDRLPAIEGVYAFCVFCIEARHIEAEFSGESFRTLFHDKSQEPGQRLLVAQLAGGSPACVEAALKEILRMDGVQHAAAGIGVDRLDRLFVSRRHAENAMAMHGFERGNAERADAFLQSEWVERMADALLAGWTSPDAEIEQLGRALTATSSGFTELKGMASLFCTALAEKLMTDSSRREVYRLQLSFAKSIMNARNAQELLAIVREYIALLGELLSEDRKEMAMMRALEKFVVCNIKNLTIDSIACEMCVSRSALIRLVKKATGLTMNDYIISIRIHTACSLLRDTQGAVHSIADAVGYNDLQYFTRLFKRHIGMLPSEYRRRAARQ